MSSRSISYSSRERPVLPTGRRAKPSLCKSLNRKRLIWITPSRSRTCHCHDPRSCRVANGVDVPRWRDVRVFPRGRNCSRGRNCPARCTLCAFPDARSTPDLISLPGIRHAPTALSRHRRRFPHRPQPSRKKEKPAVPPSDLGTRRPFENDERQPDDHSTRECTAYTGTLDSRLCVPGFRRVCLYRYVSFCLVRIFCAVGSNPVLVVW